MTVGGGSLVVFLWRLRRTRVRRKSSTTGNHVVHQLAPACGSECSEVEALPHPPRAVVKPVDNRPEMKEAAPQPQRRSLSWLASTAAAAVVTAAAVAVAVTTASPSPTGTVTAERQHERRDDETQGGRASATKRKKKKKNAARSSSRDDERVRVDIHRARGGVVAFDASVTVPRSADDVWSTVRRASLGKGRNCGNKITHTTAYKQSSQLFAVSIIAWNTLHMNDVARLRVDINGLRSNVSSFRFVFLLWGFTVRTTKAEG